MRTYGFDVAFCLVGVLWRLARRGISWLRRRAQVSAWLLAAPFACLLVSAATAAAICLLLAPTSGALLIIGCALFFVVFAGDGLVALFMPRDQALIAGWQAISRSTAAGATFGLATAAAAASNVSIVVVVLASGAAFSVAIRVAASEYETMFTRCLGLSTDEREALVLASTIVRAASVALALVATAETGAVVGIGVHGLWGALLYAVAVGILMFLTPIVLAAVIAFEWAARGRPSWSAEPLTWQLLEGIGAAFLLPFIRIVASKESKDLTLKDLLGDGTDFADVFDLRRGATDASHHATLAHGQLRPSTRIVD